MTNVPAPSHSSLSAIIPPPLQVSQWLNTPTPITLQSLRGRVAVMHTFQMLCPGCVSHGLPQAARIHRLFPANQVTVFGLHTVFEHHDVMGPRALRVLLDEHRIALPVGVDQAAAGSRVPLTMQAYGLRGTPSVVVLDAQGHLRLSHFGQIDDLALGAAIGQLLAETPPHATQDAAAAAANRHRAPMCDDHACAAPRP